MNNNLVIYPYKMTSESARDLAKRVKAKRVWPDRAYQPKANDLIINWGNSNMPNWGKGVRMINNPHQVAKAINKLITFVILESCGVSVPRFTTSRLEAKTKFNKIVIRHLLNSREGRGVEILNSNQVIPKAPLYVEFIKGKEYRVHVFDGKVIDYAKKIGTKEISVLSHRQGTKFIQRDLERITGVEKTALKAIKALGLDFGAIDIIRADEGGVFILEVNTAPGLSETGLKLYTEAIKLKKTTPINK